MGVENWGAPIAKGSDVWPGPGRMPWIKDGERLQWRQFLSDWHDYVAGEIWHDGDYIRLPALHPVYTVIAWNAAHPDQPPFFPWGGGDEAPGDWVGYGEGRWLNDGPKNTVLYRGYDAGHPEPRNGRWAHFGQTGSCLTRSAGDIIGYRTTPASTSALLEEAAQAAIALVERFASGKEDASTLYREARRIADLPSFPKAVDPREAKLLVEARRIASGDCVPGNGYVDAGTARKIAAGEWDNHYAVQRTLAALRRGIELGKEGKA